MGQLRGVHLLLAGVLAVVAVAGLARLGGRAVQTKLLQEPSLGSSVARSPPTSNCVYMDDKNCSSKLLR